MQLPSIFWNAGYEDMMKGYAPVDGMFLCLICCRGFALSKEDEARAHVMQEHGGMFELLLGLDSGENGLTANQESVLKLIRDGKSDSEIVTAGLFGATSTVRGYRLMLREKERKSKVFLAISHLLHEGDYKKRRPGRKPSKGWSILDERFEITDEERRKVLKTYFDEEKGIIKQFPSKEKQKIVILEKLADLFEKGRTYKEQEVNQIIFRAFNDISTLRRYLIEYKFLARVADGSAYWRTDPWHKE
jgi:DNA-binding CsgD family transcriptional regulator